MKLCCLTILIFGVITLSFVGVSFAQTAPTPLQDRFWNALYKELNKIQPEEVPGKCLDLQNQLRSLRSQSNRSTFGNHGETAETMSGTYEPQIKSLEQTLAHECAGYKATVPDCQTPNVTDLLQFSKMTTCRCEVNAPVQTTADQLQEVLSTHFFDLGYKVKFKKTQCQIETLDSFDTHENEGVTSYGGFHRLPLTSESKNSSAQNFTAINSTLSGSKLDPWGNGPKVLPFMAKDPQRNQDVLARQKLVVQQLFQAIKALNEVHSRMVSDSRSAGFWKQDAGDFHSCMANNFNSRMLRRLDQYQKILDNTWGGGIPEVKSLIETFSKQPDLRLTASSFEDLMIQKKGFQGLVQDIGNRIQQTDLKSFRDELLMRDPSSLFRLPSSHSEGSFSRGFKESLAREGYLETAFAVGTPEDTPPSSDNALAAADSLRCNIMNLYKRGPEVWEHDTMVPLYLANILAMFVSPPNMKLAEAKIVESGLVEIFGNKIGRDLALSTIQAYRKYGKAAMLTGVGALTTYRQMTLPDPDKLAEKSLAPYISQLCFREDYTAPTPIDAPPFDKLGNMISNMNTSVQNIDKEDAADNKDFFSECKKLYPRSLY